MAQDISWQIKTFTELTTDELYDLLKLRVDVFVVEQACYYPELDGLDRHPETLHLYCYQQNEMTSYLRILAKGVAYPTHPAIGRVVVAESARGTGLGHQLIEKALDLCKQRFAQQAIKISAQQHLEKFYLQHGFETCSAMYLEDGIPHISMVQAIA
ncbi:ElaA protein [Thalassotalea insulae]|uniref:ElaA protein n=1 Tax=Thalassotalea insulae TaxID=2056778 RepID=A0ABQ6GM60_9GAMM|nr:GNAT family N-acetyltransferase [Thalassotalea insulae]GLX77088.1 ElaA protein [Thalassotalea insulae]